MSSRIETAPGCASAFEPGVLRVDEALANILSQIEPLADAVKRPLRDCLGQVLAQPVISPINVPGHRNSAMDGYALRGTDLPDDSIQHFEVVGTAMAGARFDGDCQAGQCVRIMTGAIMPDGTDTVVMQEQSERIDEATVRIGSGHKPGQNVRQAGEDIALGTTVFNPGRKITAADLGILASFGLAEVAVRRKVRVAFFSTGDELRSVGEGLAEGEIYDSNRYTLYGMLQQLGVEILDMGVVPDQPEQVRQAFEQAAAMADVVITSGGVSVGEADYIKPTLRELGEINFWKIAMKPGRPLTYGKLGKAHFFGLPGNPVAVMVTFLQFVKPALQQLSGAEVIAPLRFKARACNAIRKRPGRMEFQRGIYSQAEDGHLQVRLTGRQGSGILSSMSLANCFIVLPDAQADVAIGDEILVEPIL